MKVLLIWDESGETINLYEFDVTSPLAVLAEKSHGCYINSDTESADVDALNRQLTGVRPVFSQRGSYYKLDETSEGNKDLAADDWPDTVSVKAPDLMQPHKPTGPYFGIYVCGLLS